LFGIIGFWHLCDVASVGDVDGFDEILWEKKAKPVEGRVYH
jgi:hypothetical protein